MPLQRARLAPPARVLIYGASIPSTLSEALAAGGVDVRSVSDFQDLCAWLVCWRDTAVALVDMPRADILRDAVTHALRRIDPGLPIAPLDPTATSEQLTQSVRRLLAAQRLPADAADELPTREAA